MTELDRALSSTLAVLQKVQPGDLDAPTPCASWDVRALINHFTDTARWWAGVVSGTSEPTDADYTAGDFVAAYEESGQNRGGGVRARWRARPDDPAAVRRVPGRCRAEHGGP